MRTVARTKTRYSIYKSKITGVLKKRESKLLLGRYIRSIDKQIFSEDDMLLLLSRGDVKAETESEVVAAKEQALKTKYHATKILQTETDNKCRLRQQFH
jgi:hypothetical protein